MDILNLEEKYCSQGDTSGKHIPKKLFKRQLGSFLFDECDIAYLDMQMFNSAANFGYKNPIYEKKCNLSEKNLVCLSGEFIHEERILLSATIGKYMQTKLGVQGRVHFTVGGAQAVDDALKLAFNHTNKKQIFAFEGGYHGRTMASSSISSSYRYSKAFGSIISTQRIPFPNCARCAYGKEKITCQLYCIQQFERLFENEFNGVVNADSKDTAFAAFVFEPVLGRGGYVFPHEEYFLALTKILQKHKVLVVVDEVQMGFFRTGKQWSFEHYGITPDILIFGKSVTNGIWPLSGVWAKEEIISPESWPLGSTHCTFANSPLAMSLARTTFELTSSTQFLQTQETGAKKFKDIIMGLKKDFSFIGRAQVKGHSAGLDIVDSITLKPDGIRANQLVEIALNEDIIVNQKPYRLVITTGGTHNSSLMLSPSLYISESELELFDLLIRKCFEKIFH